jgi:hypothetical protein
MNRLLASVTLAIVAMLATTPSAAGFALLSPLLLRVNPAGIAARMNKTSPITDSAPISNKATIVSKTPLATVDFGLDENLLRYKHEILSAVYEKSLKRGFE